MTPSRNLLINESGQSGVTVTFAGADNKVTIGPLGKLQSLVIDVRVTASLFRSLHPLGTEMSG